MAKRIKWSPLAEQKFDEILEYWTNRNKSEAFSDKLIDLFEEATELIASFPELGRPTDVQNVRQKLVRDYLIFYQVDREITLYPDYLLVHLLITSQMNVYELPLNAVPRYI